jgi:hypothetical protein
MSEPQRTRTKEEIAELTALLAEDYQNGLSLKRIGDKHDVAASYVGRLLKKAGVPMRQTAAITPIRHVGFGRMSRAQQRDYLDRLNQR